MPNELPSQPSLKDINAYKKKLTWGDVPTIFHMTQSAVGELEGLLTHGFDSSFKRLLNKNTWNLKLLEGYQDDDGNIQVKHKPQISLKHVYDEQHYELHCFPIVQGEKLHSNVNKHPYCPFDSWAPESMSMLFRVKSIVSFILFTFQSGDEADMALIKHAHYEIMKLIDILNESFEIVDIIGYNIAEFCQEINRRNNMSDVSDMYNNPNAFTE